MTNNLIFALTGLAALGSGIISGVFFAFSTFVMTALRRISPPAGMAAMQQINVAVFNPWFGGVFFLTPLACLGLGLAALFGWGDLDRRALLAGSLAYLVGSFGVTMAFNIPRNEALAKVESDSPAGPAAWARFAPSWTSWNHVRTVASLAAAVLFVIALSKD
jgi:uncharacterized membrane protein